MIFAGLFLGAHLGSAVALTGILGASLLGFLLLRPFCGERSATYLAQRPRAQAVHDALVRRSGLSLSGLIALVRLSPVMPFAASGKRTVRSVLLLLRKV